MRRSASVTTVVFPTWRGPLRYTEVLRSYTRRTSVSMAVPRPTRSSLGTSPPAGNGRRLSFAIAQILTHNGSTCEPSVPLVGTLSDGGRLDATATSERDTPSLHDALLRGRVTYQGFAQA